MAADEPFFRALLTPHRSLGRTGFAVLMGALTFGWLAAGALFLASGAWPVHARLANRVLAFEIGRRTGLRLADIGPMRAARRDGLLRRSRHERRGDARRTLRPGCPRGR